MGEILIMISVLYVDDEPSLLEIGKLFLERNGQFCVDIITSAPAALTLLKTKTYDSIISDYQMPEMDGIEFLKKIRTSGKTIPFILFTGRGREEVIIQALNGGADFYLQKGGEPVSQFTELAHQIRQAVQQRRAEASIRDLERREAEILNFLPDATFAINKTGTVIAWNHAMEKMTGIKPSEILGKGNYEYSLRLYHERRPMLIDLILAPDNQFEKDRYLYTVHDSTNLTAESIVEKPDGTHIIIWGKASRIFDQDGNIAGTIESIRDITEQRQAETELRAAHEQLTAAEEELRSQYNELALGERLIRESEEKFRSLVEYALEAILILDLQGKILFANNAAINLIEAGHYDEFIGRNVVEFLAPESREDLVRDFIQISDGHDAYLAHYNVISAKGKKICVESIGKIVSYEGKPADLISLRDVTERKRVEDELRAAYEQITAQEEELRGQYDEMVALQQRTAESKQMLNQVLNTVPVRVFWKDTDLRYLGCNEPFIHDSGFSASSDIIGKTDLDMGWKEQAELYRADDRKVIDTGIPKVGYEEPQTATDGNRIWLRTSKVPLRDPNGIIIGILGTYEDITERKRAEEALCQANKNLNLLSSITRHDITNQLMIMKSHLALLQMKHPDISFSEHFKKIDTSAQRILSMIRFTKEYEEIGGNVPVWQNCRTIVETAAMQIPLGQIVLKNDLPLGTEIYTDPLIIKVFYNLMDNAVRYAGEITTIRFFSESRNGDYIIVCEDDGIGIPQNEKEKIFERGYGKTTGLGLFLACEILSISGITLRETGEPGKGARFELTVSKGAYRLIEG